MAKRLHGLEAKAFALGDHDLALGYSALSSVAAARGDEQKMRRYHDNALGAGSLPSMELVSRRSIVLKAAGI